MATKKQYYSLKAYFSYLKRYRYRFLIVVLFFAIANGLLAVIPIFMGRLIAALAATSPDRGHIFWQAGILIFCSVTHHLTWHTAEILYIKLLNGRNNEFGNVIFKGVITKPYPYFVDKFTGKIGSHIEELTREYKEFINEVCFSYIDIIVKLPTIAIIMFSVNTVTGLVFLTSILTMFMVGRKTIKRSAVMEKRFTDKNSSLNGRVIDAVTNFVSVKSFRKERIEASRIEHERRGVIDAANRSRLWSTMFWASMGVIVRLIVWPGTILLNVWLFLDGQISLTQITTFTTALVIFSDYIWFVIWMIQMFNLKLARIEEAYRYLFGKRNVIEEHYDSVDAQFEGTARHLQNSLELKRLSFAYPDSADKPVLKNINLRLNKNDKVGIVGHSGSGKTTLIKLLLGYYQLPEEEILLDNEPTDNRQLLDFISYVPQDTSLFHRSIADNIAYGTDANPGREAIELAARRAHADDFIKSTPKGYETMVGEKGIKLSMGQRQRIAIARAFLDNKPLLILDEATSALDSESEVLVQKALEDLWSDKTVIAIAHRLSTLRHMDRIVVMDNGRIVEQGTHQDLIKRRGEYYNLWQHQHDGLIGE